MRFTDLILTLPLLAVLLTASVFLGNGDPVRVGVILALLIWTGLARIVRGVFLSLREKEFVEAAKAAGAGDARIIVRHLLPNAVGPIIVAMTLIIAAAILIEAALSFLGFGIQPPTPALGKLIADGQTQGFEAWWLVTFPGLVIVLIALAVNFVGDGLRDALDPTQRRMRA
jgi:ABC-type dipeptide/oligopeptide/nickel transport system permease subunit